MRRVAPEWGRGLRRTLAQLPVISGDALQQLQAHWRHHLLTLAGIVWGSAALILMLSLGVAFNQFLDLGIESGGDRWLLVRGEYVVSRTAGARPGEAVVLEIADLERLKAGAGSAVEVAGEILEVARVETPRRTRATVVSAASPSLDRIQNHQIAKGRWFDEEDERLARRVVVLGSDLVEPLFGSEDAVGRSIQVDGVPFQVIGVMKRKGIQLITDQDLHDNMAFVPLTSGSLALERGKVIDHVLLVPADVDAADTLRAEIRMALAPLHNLEQGDKEAFSFQSVPEMMAPVTRIGVALQVLLGLVGTVTLAIAGVGVANLMIAVVNGRRREFAVRRACGARRSDIVVQLLIETVAVVLAGGAVGCSMGLLLVGILNVIPLPDEFPPPRIVPSVVATTFLVLVGTGLVAGVLPARIASQVDPGSALRAI